MIIIGAMGFTTTLTISRLMVPDRIGLNITVNLARIGGKIFIGLLPIVLIGAMADAPVVPLYVADYLNPDPLTYEIRRESCYFGWPILPGTKNSLQGYRKNGSD